MPSSALFAWSRLLRLPNLLIVGFTQGLIFYRVLFPAFDAAGLEPVLDLLHMSLLCLVTILITACGYISNDLIDRSVDRQNRPQRVVVGTSLSVARANALLAVLAAAGVALSVYLAAHVGRGRLLVLYPAALGGLMAYNLWLKRLPLIGNTVVAAYCAGVAGILAVAEWPTLLALAERVPGLYREVVAVLSWYMAFAFFSTLMREMVKDLEDVAGDRQGRYRTLPLWLGETRARNLAMAAGLILAAFLLMHGLVYWDSLAAGLKAYVALLVWLPLLGCIHRLSSSTRSSDYRLVSRWIKGLMITGMGLLLWT